MKIIVIGASQGTGALCVQEALTLGHEVTAFARNPNKLQIEHPRLHKVTGDFHNQDSLLKHISNHDAVIVTASVSSLSVFKTKPDYFSAGTKLVIEAMKKNSVKKLVILSAYGVGESRKLFSFFGRFFILDYFLKGAFTDHEIQEDLTKKSDLEWVIARPSMLTSGASKKNYQKNAGDEKVPGSITRADLADFLVEAATTQTWTGKCINLGG